LTAAAAATFAMPETATEAQDGGIANTRVRGSVIPHSTLDVHGDGVRDDPIWRDALAVDLTVETSPRENLPAEVATTAYLVENGDTLLIAFDARDPDPGSIRAYLRDRDSAWNDDFVGVVLDTFNDERRAFEFFANPLGVQMDLINDEVNRSESSSWDSIWDSAGEINRRGFTVEMAVPFSQLRFPRADGDQTWGIDVLRFRPRAQRARISNNALDRNRACYLCQFEKFTGFGTAEPGKALEVVPTLIAGRTDTRPDQGGGLERGSVDTELGLGVRWGITPDLTLDLTLNPDFSQVEADVAQLAENTQFALFYPESRPFFLEGEDYYSSPIQVVFTRTVADPDYGAKFTGRTGDNTIGLFTTHDTVTNLLFPGAFGSSSAQLAQENDAFVGRYTRGFGQSSTIGALVTSRRGDGYSNQVAGVDGRYFINDRNSIWFQYLGSTTEYPNATAEEFSQPLDDLSGDALRLEYRYSARNWYGEYRHQRFDPTFRADSGFITRVNYDEDYVQANHTWVGDENNWYNDIQVGTEWQNMHDLDGALIQRSFQPFFTFSGPWQSFGRIGAGPRKQAWNGQEFSMHSGFMFAQFRPRTGLNVNFQMRGGEQIDFANTRLADQRRIQPSIDWNVTRHLLLRLRYTSDRLSSKSGPTIFRAKLTDLRVTWQFNVRSFVRMTLQDQNITRNVELYDDPSIPPHTHTLGSQLLYSYKLNPQTVLFAGYSDSRIEDELTTDFYQKDRTFFLKIGYAWTP
jgi:hypothetical protein